MIKSDAGGADREMRSSGEGIYGVDREKVGKMVKVTEEGVSEMQTKEGHWERGKSNTPRRVCKRGREGEEGARP